MTSVSATEPPPAASLPGASAPSGAPQLIRRIESPIGRIEILSDGRSITSLAIATANALPHDGAEDNTSGLLETAAQQLAEYFADTRRAFDLPLALAGTAFQRSVWQQLEAQPWGTSTSYGSIGIATGRKTAGRAVGGAIGANPIPIIIGCHRVLASNRRITGYSAGDGVATKVWLLDHEAIAHS